jgi:hypothetical protein
VNAICAENEIDGLQVSAICAENEIDGLQVSAICAENEIDGLPERKNANANEIDGLPERKNANANANENANGEYPHQPPVLRRHVRARPSDVMDLSPAAEGERERWWW